MFDPEKVRNYTAGNIQHEPVNEHYVKASDYDRLLVLYRNAKAGREAFAKAITTAFPIQGPLLNNTHDS